MYGNLPVHTEKFDNGDDETPENLSFGSNKIEFFFKND